MSCLTYGRMKSPHIIYHFGAEVEPELGRNIGTCLALAKVGTYLMEFILTRREESLNLVEVVMLFV